MKLYFFGAAGVVTGSCYLLETDKYKFLVDCGMFQGPKYLKERNYGKFPFDVKSIDAMFLTHAHIDHSGLIPKLYKEGYRNPIFATRATTDLCSIMLPDSGHIQEIEVERKNRRLMRMGGKSIQPIYTTEDAIKSLQVFNKCEYNTTYSILDGVSVTFKDAGHIMGSALIELEVEDNNRKEKFVFSGDLGRKGQHIINDPDIIKEADYLLIETTYGDRLHHETKDRVQQLAEIIKKTIAKGGNLIIPAFAIERTQDLLYDLNTLVSNGEIPQEKIYIDSPLAIAATEIFGKHAETYDDATKEFFKTHGYLPFLPKNLKYTRTTDESKALNSVSGAIIISANGMAEAGRVKHHLRYNLWREESSILFVGYQAEGTLGRKLIDGEKKVRIFGEDITVKADIYFIDAYSAHADYKDSLEWLKQFTKKPQKLFLVHGEPAAADNFAKLVTAELGWDIIKPGLMEYFDFELDHLIASKESTEFIEEKQKDRQDSFDGVSASLERLQGLLGKVVNKKLNREQYHTAMWEISNIQKYIKRIKKG